MAFPSRVFLTDVCMRDGFRAESQVLSLDQKTRIGEALIAAGIGRLEATAFLAPHAVPQLADAADLVARLKAPGVELGALVPNVNGAWRAIAAGVDRITVAIAASETFSLKSQQRTIASNLEFLDQVGRIAADARVSLRGEVAATFGCPYEGDVSGDGVLRAVDGLVAIGVEEVVLADSAGMATPPLVTEVLERVRIRHPQLSLALRLDDVRGLGLVNVMRGLELGVDRFEAALGGLGGLCSEDLVYLIEQLGIDTGVSLDALIAAAQSVRDLVGHELPGHLLKVGPRRPCHDRDR